MTKYFVIRNFRGTCSSVQMLNGYMPIIRNAEEVLYILICRNSEGVHSQRNIGNSCSSISPLFCFQNFKFLFTNYMHTCLLIILFVMTFGHSKLVRQQKSNY